MELSRNIIQRVVHQHPLYPVSHIMKTSQTSLIWFLWVSSDEAHDCIFTHDDNDNIIKVFGVFYWKRYTILGMIVHGAI